VERVRKYRLKMKICYVINQYPKVSHSFIRREICELERLGVQVTRVAFRGWDQPVVDSADSAEARGTHYLLKRGAMWLIADVALGALRQPGRWFKTLMLALSVSRKSDKALVKHLVCFVEACAAAKLVRSARVQHIHAHFGTNSAEVAMLTSSLSEVPFSFTVHGPEEFDHPEGLCLPEKIRRSAFVVAISSYCRSQLYRWAENAHWDRIVTVRCGLDEDFLGAEAMPLQSSRTLVCVGRLCEQKGQIVLLDALRMVLDAGHECHLVLAGDGEMRPQIEAKLRELNLAEYVEITGWLDGAGVRRAILNSRAMVLPSFAEGLPVVLMEAFALGRPVITTYVAGIPELVEDKKSGWLVPAGDSSSLADAIVECLQCDDRTLYALGARGRSRVMDQHSITTESEKLRRLFGECSTRYFLNTQG
jgi:colanic acid/amylovoran biosynthesis glycosyltransferase